MATIRKPLSKKIRFDVFKRDLFCCQYCGNYPPTVVLEVDHIIPVSKKGTNDIDNLITSCFDCNRGKSDNELNVLPQKTVDKIAVLQEKELQFKEYHKLVRSIEKRLNGEVELVNNIFSSCFPEKEFSETFKRSVKHFIKKLGLKNVSDAMERAAGRVPDSSFGALTYLCGICWNMIKNNRKHIDDRGGEENG